MARDQTIAMLQKELQNKTDECHDIANEISRKGQLVDSVKSKYFIKLFLKGSFFQFLQPEMIWI